MSTKEKLLKRLKAIPKDFTFNELKAALESLGFEMSKKGKTAGSRVIFLKGNIAISLHKPHPRNELLEYQIKQVLKVLEKGNII